jgi:hypothetical protein
MIEKRYQARFSISLRHRGCEDGTLEGLVKQFRQRYVPADGSVVDIGGGYCEFINAVRCRKKYIIDLVLSSPSRASVLARAFQRRLLRCLGGFSSPPLETACAPAYCWLASLPSAAMPPPGDAHSGGSLRRARLSALTIPGLHRPSGPRSVG